LIQASEFLGADRRAVVCRELSKLHEEIRRGTVTELIEWFTQNQPRGEIVLVLEGKEK
jgi:16S rRNA (cytidine1402-2'-O)-methyltransferase